MTRRGCESEGGKVVTEVDDFRVMEWYWFWQPKLIDYGGSNNNSRTGPTYRTSQISLCLQTISHCKKREIIELLAVLQLFQVFQVLDFHAIFTFYKSNILLYLQFLELLDFLEFPWFSSIVWISWIPWHFKMV
jgi:hypothetical protein